jgi:diacylglycerol O-acyltransferase
VVVPVNLRPPDEPLPRHLGNRIGLLPVLLPTGAADPSERLRRLQERILALKHSPAPPLSRLLLTTTVLLTPPGERAYHRFNQLRGSGVVTNVPGPTRPLHLAGARLDGIIGWGGMTGHLNLSVAFISLAGRVYAGLVSDEGITPDPDALLAGIGREWAALPTTWTAERVAPAR